MQFKIYLTDLPLAVLKPTNNFNFTITFLDICEEYLDIIISLHVHTIDDKLLKIPHHTQDLLLTERLPTFITSEISMRSNVSNNNQLGHDEGNSIMCIVYS